MYSDHRHSSGGNSSRNDDNNNNDRHHSKSSTSTKDRQERDKLDDRLKSRDNSKTKRLAAPKDTRRLNEIAKKLRLDPRKDTGKLVDEARKESRNQYLKSRAAKQIEICADDLEDEKNLFSDLNHKKSVRDSINYKEKVLTLSKHHMDASEKFKVKQYFMPDSKNFDYVEVDEDEKQINPESKIWEKTKFNEANALKSRSRAEELDDLSDDSNDFELLLDDKEFIQLVISDNFSHDLYRIDPRVAEKEAHDKARRDIMQTRKNLPVYEHREELLQAIRENQIIIVQGETGCGKTTQLPQYLHEDGYTKTEMKDEEQKMVGCTQPRRVAAMSVAARVSQEIGSKLGHKVGYSIRFEDCTSEATVIKYMTDGMLLRELLDDPLLTKYSVMIVDEAHERTLHTDILLTLLKDVTRARDDFKLVISSATLDTQKFCHFFEQPPIFKIKGRLFDVKVRYMSATQEVPTSDINDSCLRTVIHIHRTSQPGDILVFLPGQDEIEELQRDLEVQVKQLGSEIRELIIRPIYANLPTDMQAKVFEKTPKDARKVVIATNIAETSLTIDGIVYVVDPGYCKQNKFSSKTGMETLAVTRISKASADQRAGRAGRNRPGVCFRLYTVEEYKTEFEENTQPEIQRLNLANVVLLLKTMKINDVLNFDYVDKPPKEVLMFAIEQLTALGALDNSGELTLLGRRMAEFPLEPKMSKSIIVSEQYGCSEQILTIMSMLSLTGSVFFKPKDREVHAEAARKSFFSVHGDHMMLLKVYDDWASTGHSKQWCFEKFIQYKSMCRARDVREQLERLCEKVEVKLVSDSSDPSKIIKAILGGFFYNVARISRDGGSYRTVKKNQSVSIHPTSSLHNQPPRWVVFNEIKQTTKEFMRVISEIDPSWLVEVAPCFYDKEEVEELSKKKMPKFNKGKTRAQLNPSYG